MAYLTINADDFGITRDVTLGICQSIMNGIVTSTSAMACVENAEIHLREFAPFTSGVIGAHLQLTTGKPVLPPEEVPSLVDKHGCFFSSSKALPWDLDPNDIMKEWNAQISLLEQWHIIPRYLDSHHQVHMLGHILPVMAKLGISRDIPVRSGPHSVCTRLRYLGVSTPDITITDFFGKELNWERLEYLLEKAIAAHGNDAVIELCCHPGISSPELAAISAYSIDRETELSIFMENGAVERIEKLGLQLIGMDQVSILRPAKHNKTNKQV